MGQKEKLIEQLKNRPKTFTFHDAEVLLDYLRNPIRGKPAVPE